MCSSLYSSVFCMNLIYEIYGIYRFKYIYAICKLCIVKVLVNHLIICYICKKYLYLIYNNVLFNYKYIDIP